jgi:hypothetical protein
MITYTKRKLEDNYGYIEKNLELHQFFSEMEHHIKVRIPTLEINNEFKRKIFVDILTYKYEHFYN